MTTGPATTPGVIELGSLGLDRGGHLLVQRGLRAVEPGQSILVHGEDPHLPIHLHAWARARGHQVDGRRLVRGRAEDDRWREAVRAGSASSDGLADRVSASWGLAARGALVEGGGPDLVTADLDSRQEVWAEIAPRLYAQAAAGQWDPSTAVEWLAPFVLDEDIEASVVQVMTYLVENEQAALMVPARFLGRIHPYYREAMQFLATQVADEARHIEVFTRRALLRGRRMGTSSVGGRASLQTLLDEPNFAVASFLLSVLGEGTFLHLLSFLENHAPDVVTARICHLALQDEARHVAFGLAHLQEHLLGAPSLRDRLAAAIERRHDALAATAGLNDDVVDALVLLAAGSWRTEAIRDGWDAVAALQVEMATGRQRRLTRLGFSSAQAEHLAVLHTRNFM